MYYTNVKPVFSTYTQKRSKYYCLYTSDNIIYSIVVYIKCFSAVTWRTKRTCVLYLYLGWSPSPSSTEAAPTLWPGAAPSATSHSQSSPFSDREREETVRTRDRRMSVFMQLSWSQVILVHLCLTVLGYHNLGGFTYILN